MGSSLFIFGLGYSSAGIARQAQQHGWTVTSTARQPARFAPLQSDTHRVIRFDPAAKHLLDDEGLEALASAQYMLTSIPPVAARLYDHVLAAQHKLLRQVAAASGSSRLSLGYLSSTGVYGDWQGGWVDETFEARTATARGLLRLEAEQAWVALVQQLQLPVTVFRLGGIYGPRRSVLTNLTHSQWAAPPPRPSAARRSRQRFTSRCHVADVAQAVLADMQRRQQQQQQRQQQQLPVAAAVSQTAAEAAAAVSIINVVDCEPAPRGDVEAYAQQLLQQQQESATDSAAAAPQPQTQQQPEKQQPDKQRPSRQQQPEPLEEKRVRNGRLLQLLQAQLGPEAGLLAPTYREGLQLILASSAPFEQQDLECVFGR